MDEVEALAVSRAKELFGAEYANVQPHSGTSANLAVYFSVLKVGDRILSMSLPHGGHLSHGHKASITSKCFDFVHYTLDEKTELIDYDQVRSLAKQHAPKMLVAGASAYPRLIDYENMAAIAREVSAYFLVDMAHIAGLVAGGSIPSPVPFSDFVTFTCYKTMMGARGGVILCRQEHGRKLDSAVFPGCQGTSAVNMIAGKAVTFKLAMTPGFAHIQKADRRKRWNPRKRTGGQRVQDRHRQVRTITRSWLTWLPGGIGGGIAEKSARIRRDRRKPKRHSDRRPEPRQDQRDQNRNVGDHIQGHGARGDGCDRFRLLMPTLMNPENKAVLEGVSKDVSALARKFPVYAS